MNPGSKHVLFLITVCILVISCKNHSNGINVEIANKIKMLNDSAYAMRYYPNSKSAVFADSALRLAVTYHITKEEIRSNNILSAYYYFAGNPDSVKHYGDKALVMAKEHGDKEGMGMAYKFLANWHLMTNNYSQAIQSLKLAIHYFQLSNDRQNEAIALHNIAVVNEYTESYDSSIFYYNRAVAINKTFSDKIELASNYGGLGDVFHELGKNDSAIYYLQKASEIFYLTNNLSGIATVSISLSDIFMEQGKYSEAIEKANISLKIAMKLGLKRQIVISYQRLGIVNKLIGEYSQAISYYEKASKYSEEIKDFSSLNTILSDIGSVYFEWGKYDKSLKYHLQALTNTELASSSHLAGSNYYNNVCLDYIKLDSFEKAKLYANKAIELASATNNKSTLSIAYENLGLIAVHYGNKDKALNYFTKGAEIDRVLENHHAQACGYIDIARLYKNNDNKKSITYYNEALTIANQFGIKSVQTDILKEMSEVYFSQKDLGNAYIFMSKYSTLNNQLFEDKTAKQIASFEVKYNLYKKNIEVKNLQLENKLKVSELKKERSVRNLLFTLALLFISFAFLIYRQYSKLKLSYIELVRKNVELTKKEQFLSTIVPAQHEQFENSTTGVSNKFLNSEEIVTGKYSGSNISESQANELLKNLNSKMNDDKVFLDVNLTLNSLAKLLNTNSSYLSQIINDNYNSNFNNFINKYRIKEARLMLNDSNSKQYTIEWIAQKVGFNSKSVFNTAFKKDTGVTPSFYQKTMLQENLVA